MGRATPKKPAVEMLRRGMTSVGTACLPTPAASLTAHTSWPAPASKKVRGCIVDHRARRFAEDGARQRHGSGAFGSSRHWAWLRAQPLIPSAVRSRSVWSNQNEATVAAIAASNETMARRMFIYRILPMARSAVDGFSGYGVK